jgi:hypothetical protein
MKVTVQTLACAVWIGASAALCLMQLGGITAHAITLKAGVQEKIKAPKMTIHASAVKPHLKVGQAGFFYTTDFEARYFKQKQLWREGNPGRIPTLTELVAMAAKAYEPGRGQSVERQLTRWALREDPAPWVFRPKVLLVNSSKTLTELDMQVVAKVEVRLGERWVNPRTMLMDVEHFQKTATKWELVTTQSVEVPVLAAGEETWLALPPIDLFKLFARQEANKGTYWPAELKLTVVVSPEGVATADRPRSDTRLSLTPDHMALPLYLY